MKSKFKQWWSSIHQYQQNEQSPLTSTHWTQKKKMMTYDLGIPGLGLGQTQKCLYWPNEKHIAELST